MFGTNEKYDLLRCAFGRRGSGFYIYEDFYTHALRLSCWKSGEMISRSGFQFDLKLFADGVEQPTTYFADAASLTIRCSQGFAEFALTDRDHLRVRGNMELRIILRSAAAGEGAAACRGICKLPNGDWEGAFGPFGMLLLRTLEGDLSADAPWNAEAGKYDRVCFILKPVKGSFDAAIFEDMTEFGALPAEFPPFDEVKKENLASFEAFKKNYKAAPKRYRQLAEYALWLLWTHTCKVTGGFKEPMIFMHLQWMICAVSWQQSYNAMAMMNNPKEAWRMLCTMFEHQNEETGALAFCVDYFGGAYGTMPQPPFQGFAFAFLYDRFGDELLTYEGCEYLYPKYVKWLNFWLKLRNAGRGDDVVAIHASHESGWDDASIFVDGFPAANPDVNSFVALGMEALGRMARVLHRYAEAEDWERRSRRLIDTIVKDFWDGEKFITRVNGMPVESMSAVCYEPIMLGKRLPQHIIDKVAEKLTDEAEFLSPFGLTGESMRSPMSGYGGRFILGRVVAPLNMILTVGLSSAGKVKEAAMIARRFCEHCEEVGCLLGFAPYDYYPLTGEKVAELELVQNRPVPADGWPWSGWSACNIMTMLTYVIQRDEDLETA